MTLQLSVLRGVSALSSELHPPIFLAPLLASISQPLHQRSSFSTTAALSVRARKKRDGNVHRGESALRRTGLRYGNSMSKQPLPRPVLDPEKRTKIQVDPNHGLWGFFNSERKALSTLEQEKAKGRPWTVEELRHKSWEDLHSLWYICCKERNRIATESQERIRIRKTAGIREAKERDMTIRQTQAKIKHTLTERWYAWDEAWKLAENDPEVNLNSDLTTPAYRPRSFEDEEDDAQPRAAAATGAA
ncbi:mitochondrial 39-S ribosomal protein L47 (MRP-L47)-domain-containing protein [Usnea florida]